MKPVGAKTAKDSIQVLQKQPPATADNDDAQDPEPSQSTTTTRPKQAATQEPPTTKTNSDWSTAEEEGVDAFSKSNVVTRTPTQACCTPSDVTMAPKKKDPVLTTKLRGTNATSTAKPNKASDVATTISSPEDIINAMTEIRDILKHDVIRKEEKASACQTANMAIAAITEIFKQFHNHKGKQEPNDDSTRLNNIEDQLAKLTKAIMEPPLTYAQAVQRNRANPTNGTGSQLTHPEPVIKKRMEKQREDRAKAEVVLTTRDASDNMKNQLANMSEEAITKGLEEAITAVGKEHIKIRRVQKTPNHGLKIRCATEKDAEELRSLEWKKAFEGAEIVDPLYGVVIHGVSRYQIDFEKDKPDEIITRIRDGNLEEVLVEKVMPLRRRPRNPSAPTQSIVVFFKRPKDADDCIELGMHIEHKHYAVAVRYTPQCQIKQCFKCQAYGHKASVCTRNARCGKCAQEHETRECQSEMIQCANCKGSHYSWFHECSTRLHVKEQGETLRNHLPHLYTS
jgi:hypothetical protein